MKQLTFFIFLLLSLGSLHAQTQTPIVPEFECIYQEKIDLSAQMAEFPENPNNDAIKTLLDNTNSFYSLYYADGKTLFVRNLKLSTSTPFSVDFSPRIFIDHTSRLVVAQLNLQGRNLLVSDTLPKIQWTLTGETEEIAGYLCKKAVGDSLLTIWFTEEAPFRTKSALFGLPGMAVKITIGPFTYTLTRIKQTSDIESFAPPSQGEPINIKELVEIVSEKMLQLGFGLRGGEREGR